MIVLIDNYDSFTHNLARYIKRASSNELVILKNDELTLQEITKLAPSHLIISPGPGTPLDSGVSLDCIEHFKTHIPILGICLGHQAIAHCFGAIISTAKTILHGKTSDVCHTSDPIFKNVPIEFKVTRYHSLTIKENSLPNSLNVIAQSNSEIMAIKHHNYPIYGLQFHPEAYLTEHGQTIIDNFFQTK